MKLKFFVAGLLFIVSGVLVTSGLYGQSLVSQSLFPFKDEWTGYTGFKNIKGEVMIKPDEKFWNVQPFFSNVAVVTTQMDRPCYLLTNGSELKINGPVWRLNDFSDGYGLVDDRNGNSFFVNTAGQTVSDIYDNAYSFSEGYAVVNKGDKVWVVDTSFKEVFCFPMPFHTRLMTFTQDDQKNVHTNFSSGVIGVRNAAGLWGYMDTSGKLVISPRYQFAGSFSGKYALVLEQNKDLMVINKSGEEICSFTPMNLTSYDSRNAKSQGWPYFFEKYLVIKNRYSQIVIINLETKNSTVVELPPRDFGYNQLLFLDEKVFYSGSVIDIRKGEIVWTVENDPESSIMRWGKYLQVGDTFYTKEGDVLIFK